MDYWTPVALIAGIHFLAVVSPGPDFFMTVRNSILYSRSKALFFALGLSLGCLVHFCYSLYGLNLLVTKSVFLYNVVKILGAGYLICLGIKSLINNQAITREKKATNYQDLSSLGAVAQGFFTNLLNPKTVVYFLSLFTQFINPDNPWQLNLIWAIEVVLITFLWFSFVGLVMSHKAIRQKFLSAQKLIDQITGGILIAFGLKLASSKYLH